jgi:hypothetical protein
LIQGLLSLATDAPLFIIARPDNGGAALHHRTIDLDVRFVAANSRDAIIGRANLLAPKSLTGGEVGEFRRSRSRRTAGTGMTNLAGLIAFTRRDGMKPDACTISASKRVAIRDFIDLTLKSRLTIQWQLAHSFILWPKEHRKENH